MIYAQYCRLRVRTFAPDSAVIRAAHTRLAPKGRSRAQRTARHEWLRAILETHHNAQNLRREFRI